MSFLCTLLFFTVKYLQFPAQITVTLKSSAFPSHLEAADCLVCPKHFSFPSLRDALLRSFVCAERWPFPLPGLPQVSLQPLCGRPHQKQLGAGPCSLLLTVSVERPHPLYSFRIGDSQTGATFPPGYIWQRKTLLVVTIEWALQGGLC